MSIDGFCELIKEGATFWPFAFDRTKELAPECFSNVPLSQRGLKSLAQEG